MNVIQQGTGVENGDLSQPSWRYQEGPKKDKEGGPLAVVLFLSGIKE